MTSIQFLLTASLQDVNQTLGSRQWEKWLPNNYKITWCSNSLLTGTIRNAWRKVRRNCTLILHVYRHVQYRSKVSTQSLVSRSLKLEAQLLILDFRACIFENSFAILYPQFSRLGMWTSSFEDRVETVNLFLSGTVCLHYRYGGGRSWRTRGGHLTVSHFSQNLWSCTYMLCDVM